MDNYRSTEQMPLEQGFLYPADMRQALRIRFFDILVFVIPALSFLEIEMIGRLFATEIILIGLFPFLFLLKRHRLWEQMPRIFIIFCILWLFGQVTTDLIRQTPFNDWTRGWAKIVVTLINFSTLYLLLYSNRRRIVVFLLGLAVGGILQFYFNPGIYAEGSPWKFGVGSSVTWLMILIATCFFERIKLVSISVLIFAVLINLYLGFRSLAGICFLTTIFMSLQWLYGRKNTLKSKLSSKNMVLVGLAVLLAGVIFIQGYAFLAREDLLGEKAKQNYLNQASGDFGLIFGGRSELIISGRAIMDSPIIGHGSWAKDYRYSERLVYLKRMLGYYSGRSNELGLIPTHSHLFGAWVEAGILGAVFWVWVLFLPIRGLVLLIRKKEVLTPLFAFFAFLLIWDILFSPFGAERRFITPYYIIVMMSLLPLRDERTQQLRC